MAKHDDWMRNSIQGIYSFRDSLSNSLTSINLSSVCARSLPKLRFLASFRRRQLAYAQDHLMFICTFTVCSLRFGACVCLIFSKANMALDMFECVPFSNDGLTSWPAPVRLLPGAALHGILSRGYFLLLLLIALPLLILIFFIILLTTIPFVVNNRST